MNDSASSQKGSLIGQIRSWLERNQVFFNVLAATLLGVASVSVSVASFIVGREQLRISAATNEPHFSVQKEFIFDEKAEYYSDVEYIVQNTGAPAHNISVSGRAALALSGIKENNETVYLPLHGYIHANFLTGAPTGKVSTLKGYQNNKLLADLERSVRQVNDSVALNNRVYLDTVMVGVAVNYASRNGEEKADFFLNGRKVSPDAWLKVFPNRTDQAFYELSENDAAGMIKRAVELGNTKDPN